MYSKAKWHGSCCSCNSKAAVSITLGGYCTFSSRMVHYSCCVVTGHYITALLTICDTYESYLILRCIKSIIKFPHYLHVTHHRNYFKRCTDLSLQMIKLFPPVVPNEILHINLEALFPLKFSFIVFYWSLSCHCTTMKHLCFSFSSPSVPIWKVCKFCAPLKSIDNWFQECVSTANCVAAVPLHLTIYSSLLGRDQRI